jgi:hypothetical protein
MNNISSKKVRIYNLILINEESGLKNKDRKKYYRKNINIELENG